MLFERHGFEKSINGVEFLWGKTKSGLYIMAKFGLHVEYFNDVVNAKWL